ncbi:WD40-repeat-containing domain protein, partial [Vararia minispora EC-137]
DRLVHVWDLHRDDIPVASTFSGPSGSVFTLAFSASNKYLFSGGLDKSIYQYNLDVGSSSWKSEPYSKTYTHHSSDVRAVSCHPYNDEVLLSCSEDGSIFSLDTRSRRSNAQSKILLTHEVTCVQYHPTMEHIFATSDTSGHVNLRDARMAFGSGSQRRNSGVYATTIQQPKTLCYARPSASSIVFDRTGSRLAVTFSRFYPTIYSVSDIYPVAICSGRFFPSGDRPPEGERTYENSVTIKHGSFGGLGKEEDEFYTAGSDDFRGYVWKIPSSADLERRRTISNGLGWPPELEDKIAFCSASAKEKLCIPAELHTPAFHLHAGHDSIVNTVLMHPAHALIATAGIERHVLLHSPTTGAP